MKRTLVLSLATVAMFGLGTSAAHAETLRGSASLSVRCDSAHPTTVEIDGRTLSVRCPHAGTFRLVRSKVTHRWIAVPIS